MKDSLSVIRFFKTRRGIFSVFALILGYKILVQPLLYSVLDQLFPWYVQTTFQLKHGLKVDLGLRPKVLLVYMLIKVIPLLLVYGYVRYKTNTRLDSFYLGQAFSWIRFVCSVALGFFLPKVYQYWVYGGIFLVVNRLWFTQEVWNEEIFLRNTLFNASSLSNAKGFMAIIAEPSLLHVLVYLLCLCLMSGFMEICARGIVQNLLYQFFYKIHWAIWLTEGLFAVLGLSEGSWVEGIEYGYVYWWTRDLRYPIAARIFCNLFSVLVLQLCFYGLLSVQSLKYIYSFSWLTPGWYVFGCFVLCFDSVYALRLSKISYASEYEVEDQPPILPLQG